MQKLAFPSGDSRAAAAKKGELSLKNSRYDLKLFFSVSSTTLSHRPVVTRPPGGEDRQGAYPNAKEVGTSIAAPPAAPSSPTGRSARTAGWSRCGSMGCYTPVGCAVGGFSVPAGLARSNGYTLPSAWRDCARCGRTFQPRSGGRAQRFCCVGCRVAYHKERPLREPHRCPLCGREHDP